jgi:hypothetical protein
VVVLRILHGDPWVYGVLANNIWSLTSDKRGGAYNNGLIQPFVNYNFPDGCCLTSAPILASNAIQLMSTAAAIERQLSRD